ncbi:MAG: mechanosensitive ion channel family protein, partial [Bacilli bacterium]|nr:mechanosensitive ion channel family protein [Bacilli bacterium]
TRKILIELSDSLSDSTSATPFEEKERHKERKTRFIASFVFVFIATLVVIAYILIQTLLPEDHEVRQALFGPNSNIPGKIGLSVFLIFLILGLTTLVRTIIILTTRTRSARVITLGKLGASAAKYAGWLVLIFALLNFVFDIDTATLFASAGILALILGLGAQTLIADIIGGLEIVFEDQFAVGDVVVIDDFRGTVREIGLSCVKLTDAANNIKIIRNNQITTVINLSRKTSLAVCDCSVDYDSDLNQVRDIVKNSFPEMVKCIPTIIGTPTYLGVQSLSDSSIDIRLIASCKEEDKFSTTRAMNEYIFTLLRDNGIHIPYPQIVVSKREEK